MKNNKEIPRERRTAARGRTPIDTYPPTVDIPIVSNRVITDSPVREKELAPPPTPEEVKAANAGELAPKGPLKFALDIAKKHPVATGGAAVAAVVGGFAAVEAVQGNIPGIHRSVDIPQSFDKNATKGVVGPKNILVVSTEVFNKTPSVDAEGNPIFDFPWDNNHPAEIRYTKSISPNWKAWGVNVDEQIKDTFDSSTFLPVGYEVPTPYPGRLFFFEGGPDEQIVVAKVLFKAPNGILFYINMNIEDKNGNALPIKPLISAPLLGPENNNGNDWEKGTPVERLGKIFSPLKEGGLGMSIEGGKNGSLLLPKDRVPGNFNFKTGIDAAGIPKILVSDSK